jgi:hypothetical protein
MVEPLLPPPQSRPRGGRPRQVERRAGLPTLRSLHRRGCPWPRLPHEGLPTRPADDACAPWRDDGTWAKGRTRPLCVETRGVWLAVLRTRAGREAGGAAPLLRGLRTPAALPRLGLLWADQKAPHPPCAAWMAAPRADGRLEVPTRPAGPRGLAPREKRGVMERTNAWQGRSRRNRKDAERRVESRTAMIKISHRHRMLNRLSPCSRPAFPDRLAAA